MNWIAKKISAISVHFRPLSSFPHPHSRAVGIFQNPDRKQCNLLISCTASDQDSLILECLPNFTNFLTSCELRILLLFQLSSTFAPYKIQEPIPWISNFENKNIKNIWQTRFHQFHQKNATDCETKAETDALVHVCFGRSMKFNLLRKPSWKVSWFGTLSCAFGAWLLGIFFCSKSTLWQRLGLQKLKSEALSRLQFYDPQHAVSSFPSPPEASRSLLAACCSAQLQNPGTNSKRIHNRQNFRQNELNCKENICCHCSLQAFVILSTSSQPCSWNILEGPAKYRLQPAALQSLGKHVFG